MESNEPKSVCRGTRNVLDKVLGLKVGSVEWLEVRLGEGGGGLEQIPTQKLNNVWETKR